MLDGVQPGPVQRLRALPSHRADDRALAGAHARRGRRERQPDRADRVPVQQQRHDGVGRQPVVDGPAEPQRLPAVHRLDQRVVARQPRAAGRAREHLDLVARALHDDGLGRAERQRVPGDHGGDLRGRGRARQRRHHVREPLRRAPRQRLGREQARALEGVRALVGDGERDRAVVGGQPARGESDGDGTQPFAGHPQRQHEQPRVAGQVRPGLRVAAAALVGARDEARLAVAGGVGERGAHGDRQPRPPRRRAEARAGEQHQVVVAALPHRHGVGAEQLAELVDRGAGDRARAGRGRERRRGLLQELEPPGGGPLGGEQPRVVERDRGTLGDLAEQGGVVLFEPRRVAHPPGDEQAHHPAARPQRHGDGRVRAERRAGSALALATGDAREVGVVHGDQLRAARADEALVEAPRGVQPPQDVGVLGRGWRRRRRCAACPPCRRAGRDRRNPRRRACARTRRAGRPRRSRCPWPRRRR